MIKVSDVKQFEKKVKGLNTLDERYEMMKEELEEFYFANTEWDHLDALVDLIWFAIGTAVQQGWPIEKAWDRVAKANNSKVPGVTKRGMKVDMMKPEGWKPPDIRGLFA